MLPPDERSALSRNGFYLGFPGLPIWIGSGVLGGMIWKAQGETRQDRPDWSNSAWAWWAIAYGLLVAGATLGILLPRLLAARARRDHVPAPLTWLLIYAMFPALFSLAGFRPYTDDAPDPLVAFAFAATGYCILLAYADLRTIRAARERGGLPDYTAHIGRRLPRSKARAGGG